MPIDNYKQYKSVINQITGRLYIYTHTYIGNQETDLKKIVLVYVVIYDNLLLIHL